MKDCYAILGVGPNDPQRYIDTRYRLLIKACHTGLLASRQVKAAAQARAAEIDAAYATLSDPIKRADYDKAVAESEQRLAQIKSQKEAGRMAELERKEAQRQAEEEAGRRAEERTAERIARAEREGWMLTLAPGITLELVPVPAGEFLMGSGDIDTDAGSNERPQHAVTLAGYLIGRYPVTNAQFMAFVQATGRNWLPTRDWFTQGKDDHPAINVSWDDAVAFCAWASHVTWKWVRLPSEAQWEKAAEVGIYSPSDSPPGTPDEIWQWTSSLARPYPYNANDGREDQASRELRVIRGGGFISGTKVVRTPYRHWNSPDAVRTHLGFRVCL